MPVDLPQNAVLQSVIRIEEVSGPNYFINRVRYRLTSGVAGVETDTVLQAFAVEFRDVVGTAMLGSLPSQVAITSIRHQIIGPTAYPFLDDPTPGVPVAGSVATSDYSPRRAAVLTRYSFLAGRKGVGRVMFGPLAEEYSDGDIIDVSPALVDSLNNVRTAFAQEFSLGANGVWRPAIIGDAPSDGEGGGGVPVAAEPNMDVRSQKWSRTVTYLRSRAVNRI